MVRDAVDLACETGAGTRTVLVRAGSMRADANPPVDAAPTEDRPWLAGMERLDDPRLARRFVTSRLLYRRLRRYLWAPPLAARRDRAPAAGRLRGRRPRPHLPLAPPAGRAAARLRRHVVLPSSRDTGHRVALLAVLALVVAVTSRGIWRALGGEGLPAPWAAGPSGIAPDRARPTRDRRGGRARRHPRRGRGRRVGRHRRWGARPRAHAPRRRVLRLPGRHLRGRARAPGSAGAPADVPAPPSGVDPRDRDRGGPARPPAPGRGGPAAWRPWASGSSPPTS